MLQNSNTRPGGRPPPHTLSIVQHNSLGSWDVFLSLFNSFASVKFPPDVICLQDPPFWRSHLLTFQGYLSFFPPPGPSSKPKVAFYISSRLQAMATVLPCFFDRSDVAALDIFGVDLFGKSFSQFRILNLYNLWSRNPGHMTVSPQLAFPTTEVPLLVVGDFNIHHPPLRSAALALVRRTQLILSLHFKSV